MSSGIGWTDLHRDVRERFMKIYMSDLVKILIPHLRHNLKSALKRSWEDDQLINQRTIQAITFKEEFGSLIKRILYLAKAIQKERDNIYENIYSRE